jgi:hypothetical protein
MIVFIFNSIFDIASRFIKIEIKVGYTLRDRHKFIEEFHRLLPSHPTVATKDELINTTITSKKDQSDNLHFSSLIQIKNMTTNSYQLCKYQFSLKICTEFKAC